ncbi:hypothetical protein [Polaribacter sp. Hel1_85]|uniref:hypothetical protein n=1 Tax=Polaribacter sp. Hel1_85 TaxID=1250005 RepID=UPI00052BEAE4|nr:hypothetical protein [Polaribacter sp. Hel1_85]KGL62627.1 hypothetical protein PHEL85_2421 [Polaribacter sp. Hel1_85]
MKTKNTNIKQIKNLLLITILSTIVLFSSCSSNDDENLDQNGNLSEIVMQDFKEDIENLSVPESLSNSSNQYAIQANMQFESLRQLSSSFAQLFTIPANAISSKSTTKTAVKSTSLANKQTYTWSSGDTSVEYTITEESDRYSFTYYITSPDLTGKLMDGYQLIDGSYAEVKMYYNNEVISAVKWWVNDNEIKIELDSDDYKLILESNTLDYSGNLKVYYSNKLTALYQWNSDGSGTYTNYYTEETYSW